MRGNEWYGDMSSNHINNHLASRNGRSAPRRVRWLLPRPRSTPSPLCRIGFTPFSSIYYLASYSLGFLPDPRLLLRHHLIRQLVLRLDILRRREPNRPVSRRGGRPRPLRRYISDFGPVVISRRTDEWTSDSPYRDGATLCSGAI
jgi:hypothetical protein